MTKEYKVNLLVNYGLIGLFMALAVSIIIVTMPDSIHKLKLAHFSWPIIFLFLFFQGLSLPHTIIIDKSGMIVFKSLVSKEELAIKDLKLIKYSSGIKYSVNFIFNKRNISVINAIDKFDELINDLKSKNANIEIKGR